MFIKKIDPGKFIYITLVVLIGIFISCISIGIYYYHICWSLRHFAVTEKITREGILSSFRSSYSYYEVGDLIRVRFSLKNVSSQTIILEDLPEKPAYDICYTDEELQQVCWSTKNQDMAVDHSEIVGCL